MEDERPRQRRKILYQYERVDIEREEETETRETALLTCEEEGLEEWLAADLARERSEYLQEETRKQTQGDQLYSYWLRFFGPPQPGKTYNPGILRPWRVPRQLNNLDPCQVSSQRGGAGCNLFPDEEECED